MNYWLFILREEEENKPTGGVPKLTQAISDDVKKKIHHPGTRQHPAGGWREALWRMSGFFAKRI